ncbi:LysR family transcriptional regulator [Nocardia callitridis]|uniref:LysR family transcriptional regulator n=1 Tax=Nocardia callitridis TaxID=648753 RepID=A0ABP9K4N8_9NOCA
MELQQLRYVVAIAETGSFTRAAQRCHVVQSALSHQVAQLEKRLGIALFVRNNRHVRLTAAGAAFLPAARDTLAAAARAEDEVAAVTGLLRGSVALGMIATVTAVDVIGVIANFRVEHPGIAVSVSTDLSETLVEQVRTHRLDVAMIAAPDSYRVTDAVECARLAADQLCLVVADSHEFAARRDRILTLADIRDQPFVDFPTSSQARAETDEAFAVADVRREVVFEVDHIHTLVRFVRAGVAVSVIPPGIAEPSDGLCEIALADPPTRSQYLVWGKHASPAARALVAALRPR